MRKLFRISLLQIPTIIALSISYFESEHYQQWLAYMLFMLIYLTTMMVKLLDSKIVIGCAQIFQIILQWLAWNELQWTNQLWLPVLFEMQFLNSKEFSSKERLAFLVFVFSLFGSPFQQYSHSKSHQRQSILDYFLFGTIQASLFQLWIASTLNYINSHWLQGEQAFVLDNQFKIIFDFRNQIHGGIIDTEFQTYLKHLGPCGVFRGFMIIKQKNRYIVYEQVEQCMDLKQEILSDNNKNNDLDFGKSISHELSTCLNSILTLSYLVMTDETITTQIKENYLQPILLNGQQLELIVNNLKDYSDIKSKQFMSAMTEFDLIEETKAVIKFFQKAHQEKEIEVRIKYDQLDSIVFNDRTRYKQVLYQLLSNAIRYSKMGLVIIKLKQQESQIQISIKDQGIGMTIEEQHILQKIIDTNQLQRVSKYSVGCGLGICISNMILSELSQPLSKPLHFKSHHNQGSTFKFWINNQTDPEFEILRSVKSPQSNRVKVLYNSFSYVDCQFDDIIPSPISLRKITRLKSKLTSQFNNSKQMNSEKNISFCDHIDISEEWLNVQKPPVFLFYEQIANLRSDCCAKILIVDDECFNIYVMEKILSTITKNTNKAFDGHEAIQKIQNKVPCDNCGNKSYQLILLDVNMPIKDGVETVREIRQFENDGNINKSICIANSAFTDLATKQACFQAGMDYYITKPLDVRFFRDLIMRIFKL